MSRTARLAAVAWAFALGGAALLACGTDAEGVEACRILESARCEKAPGCVALTTPPHEGSPGRDVEACKRFYRESACLHGLVSRQDPGEVKVEACRVAIQNGTCEVVKDPSIAPDCAFLTIAPPVDAGTDAADAAVADGSDGLGAVLGDASPF